MGTTSYKTLSARKADIEKEWILVDAKDQVLGRMASRIAKILRGKHKPNYTPHVDCGDYVIVINAEQVRLTGNKMTDKKYVRHSGYPGGQWEENPAHLLARRPTAVVEQAIKGMLPKNKLAGQMYRNLFVYAGEEHPHEGQKPKKIDINTIK